MTSEGPPVSVSRVLGTQMCTTNFRFYVVAQNPNSGPQAYDANTVLTEPSLQLPICFLLSDIGRYTLEGQRVLGVQTL